MTEVVVVWERRSARQGRQHDRDRDHDSKDQKAEGNPANLSGTDDRPREVSAVVGVT